MENRTIAAEIDNGTIYCMNRQQGIGALEWIAHPNFRDVSLKHLIKGRDTDGRFSSHLVRIGPGGCLETHRHENQMELHEVLDGEGTFCLNQAAVAYHPGKMAIIPRGEDHRVQAGERGLIILAKFFPALV